MGSILVGRSRVGGTIRCPSSKSYTHRAIAIASLTEGESIVNMPLVSRDTLATLNASIELGVSINQQGSKIFISGKHILDTPKNIINAENSGTTIRIFTIMAALVRGGFTILTGDASLRRRPMQPAIDALDQLGVICYSSQLNGLAPIIVKGGGMQGGEVTIDGNISSQFLSALLISTIYAGSPVSIHVRGKQVSRPYIESTISTMKSFGVTVDYKPNFSEYYVDNAKYSPTEFYVPPDFSTVALLLAAGVIAGGNVKVKGLNFLLPQADFKILEILNNMNAKVSINKHLGEVTATGVDSVEGGDFDLRDTPDLLPVVSILALKARSPVRISGIAHARLKETDRVTNIASQLTKFGASVIEKKDQLLIKAPRVLQNSRIQTFNDHRLFMAFTIASLLTENSEVDGAESVDVSYPNFLCDLITLGAKISPISHSNN